MEEKNTKSFERLEKLKAQIKKFEELSRDCHDFEVGLFLPNWKFFQEENILQGINFVVQHWPEIQKLGPDCATHYDLKPFSFNKEDFESKLHYLKENGQEISHTLKVVFGYVRLLKLSLSFDHVASELTNQLSDLEDELGLK